MATLTHADVRLGQAWSRRQILKNALIRSLVRGALCFADRIPAAWLLRSGHVVGGIAFQLLRRERAWAERRITRALDAGLLSGVTPKRLALTSFQTAGRNLGRCLLLRRPGFDPARYVEVTDEARATLERQLASGRGLVFISAHLGPFEWLTSVIATLGFVPAVVVRSSYDPQLDPLVDQHRVASGAQVIHRGTSAAVRAIARALKNNRPVGFLIDLPARTRSASVSFLGSAMHLPVGPLELAERLHVPVVVGYLAASADSQRPYSLHIETVPNGDPLSMHRDSLSKLERAILRTPAEWPWMSSPRSGSQAILP